MQPERKNISGWKSLPFFMRQHNNEWEYIREHLYEIMEKNEFNGDSLDKYRI